MDFSEFNLHPDLARGIAGAGYVTCMPVQEQVLTHAFGGQDLYVQSQTGTGKTAAFLVVIYQRLLSESSLSGKKALIMAPTRELAVQIEEEAKALGRYLPFKTGSFYGGVGYTDQHRMLREDAQILVGTPGRVLDLNSSGWMNLMDLAFLVLDEADRMFDMGFYPDLRKLIKVVPPADRRQTMLFSATLNAWVKNLAWEYTKTPFEIEIEPETVTVEEIDQRLYHVPSEDKFALLLGILKREEPESAIVFCNTKRYAEIVAKRLRINGFECEFIMGDLPQSKRLRIIDDVKAGKTRYLVATDVAARGLDIEALAMVINYDLPQEAENYVHRIGRTARAGKTGKAVSLASDQDVYELPPIERYIGKPIPPETATADMYAEDRSAGMRIHTDYYEDRDGGRREGPARRDRPAGRRHDSSRVDGSRGDSSRSVSGRGGNAGRGAARHHDSSRADSSRVDSSRVDNSRGEGSSGAAGSVGAESRRVEGEDSRALPGRGSVRRDGGRNGGRERPRGTARSGGGRDGESAGEGPAGQESQSPENLSALPLEERMAHYRKKYRGGGGAGAGAASTEGAGNAASAGAAGTEPATPGGAGAGKRRRRHGRRGAGGAAATAGSGGNAPGAKRNAAPAPEKPAAQVRPAAQTRPAKKGIISRILGLFGKK